MVDGFVMLTFSDDIGGSGGVVDLQLVPLPSTTSRSSAQLFRPMSAGTMDIGFQPLPIPLCDSDSLQEAPESLPHPKTMPRKRQGKGCKTDKKESKSRTRNSAKGSTSKGPKRSKVPKEPEPRKRVRKTMKPKRTKNGEHKSKPVKSRAKDVKKTEANDQVETEFKETELKELFRWPSCMMNHVLGHLTPKAGVHMQMFTEFSGLGTPEFSMKALSAAAPDILQVKVRSCCDWDTNCQTALVNNSDPDTHVFGDIAAVLSDEMKSRVQRKVLVEAPRKRKQNTLCMHKIVFGGQNISLCFGLCLFFLLWSTRGEHLQARHPSCYWIPRLHDWTHTRL